MNGRKTLLILAAFVLCLGAARAEAYTISTVFASGSDAATLESTFLSSYSSVLTEDFESLSGWTQPTFNVVMGSITGGGYVADTTGWQYPTNEYAVDGTNYFSNGSVGGLQGKSSFTLNLSSSQNALGFYVMDPVDIGGIMDLIVSYSDGSTETIHLLDLLGGAQSSGELFYILLTSDEAFDSVTFVTSNNDGYGIDRISVASTPIPGAAWLLGAGLLGLVGYRRVRSADRSET